MKNKLLLFLFSFSLLNVNAQQTAQFSQYVFNQFAIHPAVAGSKPCLDMRLGYRTQWMGFDGRPITMWANGHGQIGGKKRKYLKTKHGIGGHVESDGTGPISRTKVYLAYAYHVPVGRKTNLAMGLYAGFQQFRFNAGKVTLANAGDNAVQGSSVQFIWPDVSPGLWLYSDEFFAGFTLWQALRNKIKNVGTDSRLTHHFVLTGGKRFKSEGGWSYTPSAALKFAPMSNPALDLTMMADYDNKIQLGMSYRNTDAIVGLFKVNFLKYFSLGYSFDFTTSKIRYSSSNTHEIILGISACPHRGKGITDCPAWN
ncbi:MAG: type IX secretion system membrane protein PorP/SprF [Flavobacteriales bacterium]|nr:type IX secretion system membrane protein PorP/SprF [Flavobacteriales bacterium]